MPEFLKVAQDGALATICFARAQGLNTLSVAVLEELSFAWHALEREGKTRVVILHGAGKVFLAGADIKCLAALNAHTAAAFAQTGQTLFQAIERSPIVSIAALHGAALGGGCELALACDIRIAAEDLKIGQPEVNLGLIPGFGGTQRLPRIVGQGHALNMILSGDSITSSQALDYGLVSAVVPNADLLDAAKRLAATILSRGPLAVQTAKTLVRQALSTPLQEGLLRERDCFASTFGTGEAQEGTQAFLEKRAPKFGS